MARDEFDTAGEYFNVGENEGALVLFTPIEHVENIVTTFKPEGTDAVLTNVVVLHKDGAVCEDEYDDQLIFQGALIAALKKRLKSESSIDRDPVTGVVTESETIHSKRVLGRIGKGDAKKGQQAPYILLAVTDEDKALARAYIGDDNPMPAPLTRKVSQYIETGIGAAVTSADALKLAPTAGGRDEFGAAPSGNGSPAPAPEADSEDDPWAKGL